jgi:hypothetical protein
MEQAPGARGQRREKAKGNVLRITEVPPDRIKAAWEPAGVKAGEQAKVPAEVRAKAPDRAVVGNFNKIEKSTC